MRQVPPDSATPVLQAFQASLQEPPPAGEALESLLEGLEKEGTAGHALALLRLKPGHGGWEALRIRLKALAASSRDRRMSRWQADPHRRTLRLRFEVDHPACDQHPPALLAQVARVLLDAGLPLAMGLEKVPRPAVTLGHPLPLGVPGRGEWADAGLDRDPGPAEALPALLNARAPEGLRFLACETVPNHASPVSELCRSALWRWSCPAGRLEEAARLGRAFLEAASFCMEKPGKTGGQKGLKRIEIRPLVEDLAWEGGDLLLRTAIQSGQAPNPQKLLAAILGGEPAAFTGLERLELALGEDPRLEQADRYEPKLHNMYEDAVPLGAGSHIRIVDEGDDDEPILIRR